jgi:hypothetical protein
MAGDGRMVGDLLDGRIDAELRGGAAHMQTMAWINGILPRKRERSSSQDARPS